MGCCSSDLVPSEPQSQQVHAQHPQSSWGPPHAQPCQPQYQVQQGVASAFLRTVAPCGLTWSEYVKTGLVYMDGSTGMLAGPWAECLCWGALFEHTNDWQSMPEYANEGPVGGILEVLRSTLAGRMDAEQLMGAADRLEEQAHLAADVGQPLPVINRIAEVPPVGQPMPEIRQQGDYQPSMYGQQPGMYGQQDVYGQNYGGGPGTYGQQPGMYGQQDVYGQSHSSGPTLLQQQDQNKAGGMGTGGKMALAAAGGVAAGVGGYYLATHMDDVGDALGGAAEFVGDAGETAFDFVHDGVEDVVDFVGDVF